MDQMPTDWIYHFTDPDDISFYRVRDIIGQMQINNEDHREERPPDIDGDLETVMGRLWAVVLNDWRTNSDDDELPGFDYVVEYFNDSVAISTRLFIPGREGSVYYGRRIRRKGVDRYELWVFD